MNLMKAILSGKLDASNPNLQFCTLYQIRKASAQGPGSITGKSPSGRTTATCDRCGIGILNVYVFADSNGNEMHVGIDCAGKMGIPLDELKKARSFKHDAVIAAHNEECRLRRVAAAERQRTWLEKNADSVSAVNDIRSWTQLSVFEQEFLDRLLSAAGFENIGNIVDNTPETASEKSQAELFACITLRRFLVENQKADTTKLGRIKVKARIWRAPFSFETPFGRTYVNFLVTSPFNGQTFVYKGGKRLGGLGEEGVLAATIEGYDTRDGLQSAIVKRPKWTAEDEKA